MDSGVFEETIQHLMQIRQNGEATPDQIRETIRNIGELNQAVQKIERSLLESPEVLEMNRKTREEQETKTVLMFKQAYSDAHEKVKQLLGDRYQTLQGRELYDALPGDTMDVDDYKARLCMIIA